MFCFFKSERDIPCIGAGLEEQGDITTGRIERRHGNDEADHAQEDGSDNVPEFLARAVRVPRVDERDDAGKDPWWRAEQ